MSPQAQVDDPVAQCDWEDMTRRFVDYVSEHGDGQVPKTYKRDPELGGWVAARAHAPQLPPPGPTARRHARSPALRPASP